jgi:hypothetical protein
MGNIRRNRRRMVAGLIAAGLAAAGTFHSPWGEAGAAELATVKHVAGSNLKQVVLSSMAAKRLGIEIGMVREEEVRRWLLVSSEVETMEGRSEYALAVPEIETIDSSSEADDSAVPVRVKVPGGNSEHLAGKVIEGVSIAGGQDDGEEKVATDGAAKTGDDSKTGAVVFPAGSQYGKVWFKATAMSPSPDDGGGAYFAIDDNKSGLHPGQRVIVRVMQPGGRLQKVVPYSAVVYDLQGNSWVYVNPEPLLFLRHSVTVEHVEMNLAILADGPAPGSKIVTVGAGGLLGIERQPSR